MIASCQSNKFQLVSVLEIEHAFYIYIYKEHTYNNTFNRTILEKFRKKVRYWLSLYFQVFFICIHSRLVCSLVLLLRPCKLLVVSVVSVIMSFTPGVDLTKLSFLRFSDFRIDSGFWRPKMYGFLAVLAIINTKYGKSVWTAVENC